MPWAFTGGPVDVGHGRYGRLDAGNGAEVPGMAQKRAEGLHLDSEGRKEDNQKLMRRGLAQHFVQGAGEHHCVSRGIRDKGLGVVRTTVKPAGGW